MTSNCSTSKNGLDDGIYAKLKTNKGEILLKLTYDKTPITVANFVSLAEGNNTQVSSDYKNKPFYDGIIFHRVIEGFMAQTGDPLGNGTGGSGKNLKAEFSDYKYKYGTVGMARSSNPDSGDSQFFICFDGCDHLTGQYTVWGQVETGMKVVEKIEIGEPPSKPDQIIEAFVGKRKTK